MWTRVKEIVLFFMTPRRFPFDQSTEYFSDIFLFVPFRGSQHVDRKMVIRYMQALFKKCLKISNIFNKEKTK